MNQTKHEQRMTRVEFYSKKWQDYKDKFPNRKCPCHSTIQKWEREFERSQEK